MADWGYMLTSTRKKCSITRQTAKHVSARNVTLQQRPHTCFSFGVAGSSGVSATAGRLGSSAAGADATEPTEA